MKMNEDRCVLGWELAYSFHREKKKKNKDFSFNCLSKMHLDLDTNYPYFISFYHDSVWCLAVTRPGRDCLSVAPLTPQRPDQYHHRPRRGGVLRRPGLGAGQPPSEAINLQSTESLRPSPPSRLRGQCPVNCLSYLDLYKSANYFIT